MIKNIFSPGKYPNNLNFALMLLRLAVGVLMLTHGVGKLSALLAEGPIQFPDPIGLGAATSLTLAVFAEFFCSILLILGLGTRLAAIPLLTTMLVAAIIVHANDGIGKQELPLIYASIYFIIIIVGAGKFSIDNWIYKK